MDQFLRKITSDPNTLFQAVGAIATLAAVIVALMPHFLKWWSRPKLWIEIKIPNNAETIDNPATKPVLMSYLRIRNGGGTTATNVRAIVTQLYRIGDNGIHLIQKQQTSLPMEVHGITYLVPGITLRFAFCGIQTGWGDLGFRIGSVPAFFIGGDPKSSEYEKLKRQKLEEVKGLDFGNYAARVVLSADNATPTAHLIFFEANPEPMIGLLSRCAKSRIRRLEKSSSNLVVSKGD